MMRSNGFQFSVIELPFAATENTPDPDTEEPEPLDPSADGEEPGYVEDEDTGTEDEGDLGEPGQSDEILFGTSHPRRGALNYDTSVQPWWEIRVLSKDTFNTIRPNKASQFLWGAPLIVVPTFIECIISPEISGPGAGSVTLDLDAVFWKGTLSNGASAQTILEYDHIWQVFEGDSLRFEFLGQQIEEIFLDSSETRAVTISGPGIGDVLRWAKVFTPLFPKPNDETDKSTIGMAHFPNDKYYLTKQAKADLDKVYAKITFSHKFYANGVQSSETITPKVNIVGHTDSNGSDAHNMTLGMNRAKSAKTYLLAKAKTAGKTLNISVSSKGEKQPTSKDSNNTPSGRAKNRRVEVSYPVAGTVKDTASLQYYFYDVPAMNAWLQLLADSKKRGTIPFVRPTFTKKADSAGVAWTDRPANTTSTGNISSLSTDVLFFNNSSKLNYATTNHLKVVIEGIVGDTPSITVTGHTDSKTDSKAKAKAISLARAQAVAAFIKTLKPKAKVKAVGLGYSKPVAKNNTKAGQAKNRRVTIQYPGYKSTLDKPYYQPDLGINLLDLLKQWTGYDPTQVAPLRAEWYMHPGFRLDVRRKFGMHREKTVIFHEGSNSMVTNSRNRSREEIVNLIAIRNEFGKYWVKSSPASIKKWHQREYFEQPSGTNFSSAAMSSIAQFALDRGSDQRSTWTIMVPAYSQGRRVFVDYQLGDWIGISHYKDSGYNTTEAHRVLAISMRITGDGAVDTVELKLQNLYESRMESMQTKITAILNHQKTAPATYIQPKAPITAKPGDFWTYPIEKPS